MIRFYRYRLYPTRGQDVTLRETMERIRELYNAALEHRRDAYRRQGANISAYSQMREISGVRDVRPEYATIHTHLLQDAITRLDRAYRAFFRRVKAGEAPGFPRFKGRGRYRTFTFKDAINHNGVRLLAGGKRVKLTGIGNVKIKLHREMQGRIKQASVTLGGDGHWYIAFVCDEVPYNPLPATGRSVGIDVGITTFAALSDGTMVDNPRPYESAQRSLGTAQRRIARRKRGSQRRRKAVTLFAKQSNRVRRVRLDFQHKVAAAIVGQFDSIAVEDLNIKGLAKGRLAKQVHDAAWGQFISILASKAESAGRELFKVNPRGTSQRCSGCDKEVRKGLHVRVHDCPNCGLVLDRDINAARNICKTAGARPVGEGLAVSGSKNREDHTPPSAESLGVATKKSNKPKKRDKYTIPYRERKPLTQGEALVIAREIQGISQEELAERANLELIDIIYIECGRWKLGDHVARKIGRVLGIPPRALQYPTGERLEKRIFKRGEYPPGAEPVTEWPFKSRT